LVHIESTDNNIENLHPMSLVNYYPEICHR